MKAIRNTLICLGLCAGLFAAKERAASKGNCDGTADILLILGCRVHENEPSQTLALRIDAAAEYLTLHPETVALACGGIVQDDQNISEALAIKQGLMRCGIEEERILLEDKSTTTEENFLFAKRIIEEKYPHSKPKIAFLSSDFHLLRAAALAKLTGMEISSVAAPSPKGSRVKNYIREMFVFPAVLGAAMKRR
ncbi:MAG: YdcF family protein [Acutalibacteraceae bacterium]